jgi:glutathione S-transferase
MGTAPIIRDGDLMLVETGAIIEYILGRYGNGRLVPKPGTPEHGRYLLWMHFAEGTAAFGILTEALLQMQSNTIGKPNRFQKLWRERNDRMIPYLEQELSQRAYFAGPEFTGADIMMAYNFNMFERFLRPLTDCKHIKDYCARVFSRPAYAKAMEISLPGGDMANPDPFASRKP